MILRNEMTGQAIEVADPIEHTAAGGEPPRPTLEELIGAGKYQGFAQVTEEIYRAAPYYNNGFLTDFRRSPAHAVSNRFHPKPKTEALEFGSLVHVACLERHLFEQRFVLAPKVDKRTKEGKAEWAAFQAEHAGKTLLDPETYDQVKGMVDAVDRHPIASKLLTGGEKEISLFVFDEQAGLRRKVKVDQLDRENHIVSNFKTTNDASFRAFQRDVWKYGYHRQSAGELEIYNLLTGANTTMAPHICVEKVRPYAVAVYLLDDGTIDRGMQENRALLERIRKCDESGEWPGYPNEIQTMNLPSFAWDEEI